MGLVAREERYVLQNTRTGEQDGRTGKTRNVAC